MIYGFYAAPEGFDYFPNALDDENVLYAFHMVKPWAATIMWNINNGSKLNYPGEMEYWGRTEIWDADRVAKTVNQPLNWATKHNIDHSHIVMSEFGCIRHLKWCHIYMEDVLKVADETKLHWTFYAFRSDSWAGRDYELGSDRYNRKTMGISAEEFWQLSEEFRLQELPRSNATVFEPIRKRLQANTN